MPEEDRQRLAPRLLLSGSHRASSCWPCSIRPGAGGAQCDDLPGCVLVWSDEFDGTEVDLSKWTFQLGDGTEVGLPGGWGNNELQYYQAENATVAGGFLTITAKEESVGGLDYTSARMRSLAKGDWTFGRMEMRAKMPIGQGLWPAFWMLSSDTSIYGPWAASGEIDIVEYLGSEPDGSSAPSTTAPRSPATSSPRPTTSCPPARFNDDFHVFAIEWEFGEIRWYVDGVQYASRDSWFSTGGPFPAPFDVDFHLLLNLAVGGNLPGPPDGTTVFPQEYVIDYVRVYQVPNDPPVVTITSPTAERRHHPRRRSDDHRQRHRRRLDPARRSSSRTTPLLGEDDTAPYELTVPNVAAGCYTLARPGPRRRRRAGGLDTGRDHGRRRLPAGALSDDRRARSPARSRPRTTTSAARASPTTTPTRRTTAAPTGRPRASTSRARPTPASASTSAGRCPASGSSTRWTSPPAPRTSRSGWPRRSAAARCTSSSTASTRPARSPSPGTGAWQSWTTVAVEDVAFDGGVQTLRLAIDAGEFNVNKIRIGEPAAPPPGGALVFDDMEHGNPFGNGWFAFGGSVGGGGIGPNAGDLPPADGGVFSLETGWGRRRAGLLRRLRPHQPGRSLRHDRLQLLDQPRRRPGLHAGDQPPGRRQRRQHHHPAGRRGVPVQLRRQPHRARAPSPAAAGSGCRSRSADFFKDTSFLFGGNGVLDAVPTSAGGNGQLINVVFAVISNSGADATFRTDYWNFTPPPPTEVVFDDMEHGNPFGNGWFAFGGSVGGGGIGPNFG